jgi:OOP family OmpA-OmpF porin
MRHREAMCVRHKKAPWKGNDMIPRVALGMAVAIAAIAFAGSARAQEGWYVRGDLGWTFEGEVNLDELEGPIVNPLAFPEPPDGNLGFGDGWVGSFGGGYSWASGLRAEGEIAYRDNDIDETDGIDGGGDASSFAVMVNGYWDFNKSGVWEPYVGLGVGWARVEVSGDDSGPPPISGSDDGDAFAWQGMIGVAWEVTPQTAVDFSYRYFEAPDLEFSAVNDREADYTTQSAMIGVRYTFAPPPPPPPPPAPPPAPRPAAPPPPAACPTSEFVVYFEWDRSDLNQAGQETIASAVNRARECNVTNVQVVGHTDTSGSAEYNQGLAGRRAQIVGDALVAAGMPASLIAAEARGETDLARETADGVREPLNRRSAVTIRFR